MKKQIEKRMMGLEMDIDELSDVIGFEKYQDYQNDDYQNLDVDELRAGATIEQIEDELKFLESLLK